MARPRKQSKLDSFLRKDKDYGSCERLVCKGSQHQGMLVDGGRQCVCVSLCFMSSVTIEPSTPSDVDHILQLGTDLYHSISTHGGYMLINEIPSTVNLAGRSLQFRVIESRGGSTAHAVDDLDALCFSIKGALKRCYEESDMCFMTVGNYPSYTIGTKKTADQMYLVMDSHSRDESGKSVPDGKAVVLRFRSLDQLVTYIREMCESLSSSDMPFEATSIACYPLDTVHSPIAPCEDVQDPSVEARVDSQVNENATTSSAQSTPVTQSQQNASDNSDHEENDDVPIDDINTQSQLRSTASILCDIYNYDHDAPDDMKYLLYFQREPHISFKFPSKTYTDKRRKSGNFKRSCVREWFSVFNFISYSVSQDGLYCLPCRLFPDSSHRRPIKLIREPYSDWKHAKEDMKMHATTDYHQSSMAKLEAFRSTHLDPSSRIDATLTSGNQEIIQRNRQILMSIIKSLVFCGRQGIALRGHRDDDTDKGSSTNKGNFKELLNFRVEAGDSILENHLNSCKKNATYTSKTSQNDLLLCLKNYIQNKIVSEVRAQGIGPYYGIQCDEVTDSSNWEQLGLVIRYTVHGQPKERLLEFIECETITGVEIASKLIESLSNAGLDTQLCRSQTMDGAGNMSGKYNGCAAKFREHSPKAVYHYCSSHDLNLVLCKSSKVKEIHIMLDALKQLGIFFRYSPKRCRRLEKCITDVNNTREEDSKIKSAKFKIFCETRWVEKFTTIQVFNAMYQPIIDCLSAIGTERGWDTKAVTESQGLLKRITDATFIVCFQTAMYYYGYLNGLSRKLQGTALDLLQGYSMVDNIKSVLISARGNDSEYDNVYQKAEQMAEVADTELVIPRRCGRQTQRSNIPGDTPRVYFKRAIYLPYIDALIQEYSSRFNSLSQKAVKAMALIPAHLEQTNRDALDDLLEVYKDDLPMASSFQQEYNLWQRQWSSQTDKPNNIKDTLVDSRVCPLLFPNITKVLNLLLLTSVTASSVERANSSLRFVKNSFRSSMSEDRFNALVLLFVHKDIDIDIQAVLDMFARKYPRRMLLLNPLA